MNAATVVITASAHTLYAQWTANSYEVTFSGEGGTPSTGTKDVTFASAYGTLPTASRTGYAFDGWFTAATGGTEVTAATVVSTASAHTLYAQWTANKYDVSFSGEGGTPSAATKEVTFAAAYGTLPTATRTGYTFKGWFTSATGGTEVTAATVVRTASA
ncbi:MAG: InlB B-repeat-containing protein, partial [Lachnospiraceae bacterium]